MSLQDTIMTQIKDAMKAKDQDRLAALRAIKSELLLLQTSGKGSSEEDEVKMLQKLVKQRKESAELYTEQNRQDLADPEIFQANVISEFLPAQLLTEQNEPLYWLFLFLHVSALLLLFLCTQELIRKTCYYLTTQD